MGDSPCFDVGSDLIISLRQNLECWTGDLCTAAGLDAGVRGVGPRQLGLLQVRDCALRRQAPKDFVSGEILIVIIHS